MSRTDGRPSDRTKRLQRDADADSPNRIGFQAAEYPLPRVRSLGPSPMCHAYGRTTRNNRSSACASSRNQWAHMSEQAGASNFIRDIVADDHATGKHGGRVVTRFPPEPNGYLHIGHAKSICLNFGIANNIPGGICHLRFDDTNPTTEDLEYVQAIQDDIRWLGFDWHEKMFFASDYFEQLYEFAMRLIRKGLAYVDTLTADEIRAYRGTLTQPGKNSPFRDRSVEEHVDLFQGMRAGQ